MKTQVDRVEILPEESATGLFAQSSLTIVLFLLAIVFLV